MNCCSPTSSSIEDGFLECFLFDGPSSEIVEIFLFRVSRSVKVEDFRFLGVSPGIEEVFLLSVTSSGMVDVFLFRDNRSVNVEDFLFWGVSSGTEDSFLLLLFLSTL